MPSRATKADHVGMGMYEATVRCVRQLTPHLKRITVAAPGLRTFRDDGPDQRFKLLLPRPGQDRPVMPDERDWYRSWLAMSADVRPVMRTYTVRSARPADGELDFDMLVHYPGGPGSDWASNAGPGDRVGLYAAWGEYDPPDGASQLIVGDHAASPAIAAICERLHASTVAQVVIEVSDVAERLPLYELPAVDVDWVTAVEGRPGAALLSAVRNRAGDERPDYAWVCADQETVAAIRRHLVRERGLRPEQVMFMGYWRTDGSIEDG